MSRPTGTSDTPSACRSQIACAFQRALSPGAIRWAFGLLSLALLAVPARPVAAEDAYQLGYDYYQKEQYSSCAEEMEKAVKESPDEYKRQYLLGLCYAKAGKWDSAIEPLKKATMVQNDSLDGFKMLGQAYFKLPKPDYYQAQIALERAAKLDPKDASIHYLYGFASLKIGKHAAAIEALKQARELNPKDKRALRELGTAYVGAKDWANAEKTLAAAAQELGGDCGVIKMLAAVQMTNAGAVSGDAERKNLFGKAFATVKDCAAKGDDVDQMYTAGKAALFSERADDAISFLGKVVAKSPKNHQANSYLGQAYELKNQEEKALAAYQKALEIGKAGGLNGTDLADYLYRVGHAHHLLKAYKEAVTYYDQAMKISPDHDRATAWKEKAMERIKQAEMQE
ncbi:MAG: tetratricopeptide repeat protein [Candidatus Schekmanbacteria bacterium]|nr:tetratricopeptide repeat protein [Candidatus Schekmanbacteria bacterium]